MFALMTIDIRQLKDFFRFKGYKDISPEKRRAHRLKYSLFASLVLLAAQWQIDEYAQFQNIQNIPEVIAGLRQFNNPYLYRCFQDEICTQIASAQQQELSVFQYLEKRLTNKLFHNQDISYADFLMQQGLAFQSQESDKILHALAAALPKNANDFDLIGWVSGAISMEFGFDEASNQYQTSLPIRNAYRAITDKVIICTDAAVLTSRLLGRRGIQTSVFTMFAGEGATGHAFTALPVNRQDLEELFFTSSFIQSYPERMHRLLSKNYSILIIDDQWYLIFESTPASSPDSSVHDIYTALLQKFQSASINPRLLSHNGGVENESWLANSQQSNVRLTEYSGNTLHRYSIEHNSIQVVNASTILFSQPEAGMPER